MKRWLLVLVSLIVGLGLGSTSVAGQAADMNTLPNPIDAHVDVWIKELTVVEVRDAIRQGMTTAIVAAGGLEQNGPFNVTGKHSFMVEATAPAIARKLGNALVAPIIDFVPNGDINPHTSHMQFAGSISVRQETYEAMLTDIVGSLAQHGFTDIVLIGDSGGGEQLGMQAVSDRLNAQWRGRPAHVYYIPEYYTEDRWNCEFMKNELGIVQKPDECSATRDLYHDSYEYEAMVATTDPTRIRPAQRIKAGLFEINGVNMAPIEKTIANGLLMVDYRADLTVRAIKKAMESRR
jgi:creatinine amidohydrolase/Fe(II)-dependent formamide hydrolase-like protein